MAIGAFGGGKIAAMELDLTAILDRNAPPPPVLSAAMDDSRPELGLDLSLRLSSGGNYSSRKRCSGNEGVDVEGKKSKVAAESSLETNPVYEARPVSYGLQVIPVIFRASNGFSCVIPYWIPRSGEKSVYQPGANWNPAAASLDSREACARQSEVADVLSPPGSSISRISHVVETSSANGESSGTAESRSGHSCSCSYGENPSPLQSEITKSRPIPKHLAIRAASATRMQTVSTRSEEGKKINGRLYRFSKNKVRIMCGCHGRLFTPADFVRHAGGKETAHPLRQIVVEVQQEL